MDHDPELNPKSKLRALPSTQHGMYCSMLLHQIEDLLDVCAPPTARDESLPSANRSGTTPTHIGQYFITHVFSFVKHDTYLVIRPKYEAVQAAYL